MAVVYREVKRNLRLKIRQLRLRGGLSQAALAAKVGISEKHLHAIENGGRGASIDLLCRLANVFAIDLPDVFRPPEPERKAARKKV